MRTVPSTPTAGTKQTCFEVHTARVMCEIGKEGKIPLVYTYKLTAPFDDFFTRKKHKLGLGVFGMNLTESMGFELYDTDQDNQPLMWLHRLAKANYATDDPSQADLFFIPFLPKKKRDKEWRTTCLQLGHTHGRLLAQLPYLNEKTAPYHFILVGKSFAQAGHCTGFFSKPVGIFKYIQRISNEATPRAYSEENLEEITEEHRLFYSIVNANESDYPNHLDIPRPSSIHWRNGKAPADVGATKRSVLMSYMGKLNHGDVAVRRILKKLCTVYPDDVLLCLENFAPEKITTKLHSKYCLEPTGDSPARKSITDSLSFGCIPIFIGQLQKHIFSHLEWAESSVTINRTTYIGTQGRSLIEEIQNIRDSEYAAKYENLRSNVMPRIQLSLDDCNEDVLILTLKQLMRNARDIEVPLGVSGSNIINTQDNLTLYFLILKSAVAMCTILILLALFRKSYIVHKLNSK